MLLMFESLMTDIMLFSPEYIMLLGAPELPRLRAKRFFTVRQGRHTALVEA